MDQSAGFCCEWKDRRWHTVNVHSCVASFMFESTHCAHRAPIPALHIFNICLQIIHFIAVHEENQHCNEPFSLSYNIQWSWWCCRCSLLCLIYCCNWYCYEWVGLYKSANAGPTSSIKYAFKEINGMYKMKSMAYTHADILTHIKNETDGEAMRMVEPVIED